MRRASRLKEKNDALRTTVPHTQWGRGTGPRTLSLRRLNLPRFADGALEENARKAGDLARVAARLGATPAQVSLAWLLRQGDNVFPIPGSKTASRVAENVGAIALAARLTDAQVAEIGALDLAAAGARYAPAGLAISFEARTAAEA